MPDTVTLRDSEGRAYGVPLDQVPAFKAQGFREETTGESVDRNAAETFAQEHGGVGGAVASGLVGGLSGLTLGGSDLALGALGADRTLRHLEAEHPYAAGGGQIIGALAPTVLTGGAAAGEEAAGIGARILAHSPAGLAGKVGHAVSGLGEGAGLAGRVAAGTAGAAAEGALYGGGQYLTETALEDKPLSAEGFVAGMGHGALFGAPIGAAGTLASGVLQKAASLFPRSEVSAAAAAGVKEQASGALAQTVRDGDAMVQAAERKLSDIDAGIGMAQTGEGATRRVFGAADPQALADQVSGATARQEVSQALEGYQQARQQFEDWIVTEADPELEKALAGLTPGELQTPALASPRVPIGEFGAPGARGIKTPEELQRIAEGSAGDGLAPALAPEDATGAGGPRALRAQGTPVGGVPAQEIVQRGMADEGTVAGGRAPAPEPPPVEQPATAVGKRPAAAEPADIPDHATIRAHEDRADDYLERTVPARAIAERGYYEPPGGNTEPVRVENARRAIAEGQREPIKLNVSPEGKITVTDGRHRLQAAIEADAPIKVKWSTGSEPADSDVLRHGPAKTHEPAAAILERHGAATRLEHMPAEGGKPERIYLHLSSPSGEGVLSAERTADGGFQVGRTALDTKLRGKGVGSAMYERLNQELESQYGKPLMSAAPADRSKAAEALWKRFEKRGLAERTGDRWVMKRPAAAGDDLLAGLQGTARKVNEGQTIGRIGAESPARAEYVTARAAKQKSAAEHFRAEALAKRPFEGPINLPHSFDRAARAITGKSAEDLAADLRGRPTGIPDRARVVGRYGAPGLESEAAAKPADPLAAFGLESDPTRLGAAVGEVPDEARALALPERTAVDKGIRERMSAVRDERAIAKAIMRHNGKNADMGPRLAREAKVIGDLEAANARLADALGSEAPPTAVTSAKAFHEATAKAQERSSASSAKLGADLQNKVPAMTGGTDATAVDDDVAKALRKHESRAAARAADKMTVSPAPEVPTSPDATSVDSDIAKALRQHDMRTGTKAPAAEPAGSGVGGKLADVGSALEVMHAIGMHVPAISHIPVIGPILGLWLKARAVMGIIGRKGGSIGKSTEGLIAGKAAAVQDRIVKATGALLEGGARAAKQASHLAGPAVLLAGALFPGGEKPASDKPRDLFAARSDDITRAMQPGAIDQAIAQRFPTSDPAMHDAIVAQVQRGIAFLDSKRPKQTVLPGVLPGDGTWAPSAAAIEEFGKYVHAVNDPVSVLEDLAKGHPSAEGAETLRVVYPQLYQYAQKQLLAAAPEMAKTLPYSRRVMLSILYQIPVDGTMQPSHAQFLQTPAPAAPAGKPPNTGPLRLGQQTLSPLDQRASGA